jgi:hypothetical protein
MAPVRAGWYLHEAERIQDIGSEVGQEGDYWYGIRYRKDLPGLHQVLESSFRVRLGKSPEGRLICTGLILGAFHDLERTVEPVEIQAGMLREIPLAQAISEVARLVAEDPVAAKFFEVRLAPFAPPRLRPGPKGHSREHFDDIWQLYRAALEREPRAPVKTVLEQINADRPRGEPPVSDATLRRWIRRARKEHKKEEEVK